MGSAEIGLGHVSRVTSLIRALPPDWSYIFHINDNLFVKRFLAARGIDFECGDAIQLLRAHRFDRLIYDELVVEEDFLCEAKAQEIPLLGALDFFFYEQPLVDVIVNLLNQNLSVSRPALSSDIRYCEGLEYAIIASRFQRNRKQETGSLKNILIMYGGADQNRNTQRTLAFLNSLKNSLKIDVIVGPLNPSKDEIVSTACDSRHEIRIFEDPEKLVQIMGRADGAFTGCGTTCFELGFLGVPSIVVPQNLPEQRLAKTLFEQGVVLTGESIEACWEALSCRETRLGLEVKAKRLFDGRGAERIFSCFEMH